MQNINGLLVLSPTDLTKHLGCVHATTLDVAAAHGQLAKPVLEDDALNLVFALGLAHEADYLERLRARGLSISTIETAYDADGRRQAEQQTLAAMREGVDVVYQATFYDGAWGGQADFLLRVDRSSELGSWSYDIADTKLARRMKVPALLQMAVYAERLEVLQGVPPQRLSVVTGDGKERPWRLVDVAAYARRARGALRRFVEAPSQTEPVPVSHCGQCRWIERCAAQWRRQDDLSLVAFMRGDHREALRAHGIVTLAQLAECEPEQLPSGIGKGTQLRLVQQAGEQVKERRTGQASYLLLPPEPRSGLLRLPTPDAGDLFLDFEGDPYAEGGEGREYLAGLGDRAVGFTPLWAHSRDEERALTIELVDRMLARWKEHPGMHVYHYAPYETTALKRLTARHGVREHELDQLLRAERFVDLYAVVRQGMRISKGSYSIKKLEDFYWKAERNKNEDVADAMSSVIAYERWLVERDDVTLKQIEHYNRDDVRSTLDLLTWLEERRAELEEVHGPQPRPHEVQAEVLRPPNNLELAEVALAERLRSAGQPLLADLVQWHRREDRPAWWEVFRLDELDDDELIDDPSAIGGLSAPVAIGTDKRSTLYEYRFPPQDTKVKAGPKAKALDVDQHCSVGTVVELDAVEGRVVVKRQGEALTSRGFGPPGPIDNRGQREAIAAAGEAALAGQDCLALALVQRRVPRSTEVGQRETAAEAVVRVGRSLSGEVLAVQGPPGSGKTTAAGALIRALLDDGKTIGVTAMSHAVIGNILKAVGRPGLQKCEPDQHCGADLVTAVDSNAEIVDALAAGEASLVGGTSWLWARDDMAQSVDVLVIDEAGQFSLANAVAVARSARSMVLLGDPQQLAQPSQALHPDGAGASALEHLLEGHDTIASDRGIFLDRSWRMHPTITDYVSHLAYDGRLQSTPGRDLQEVLPGGLVAGSGLRWLEVQHHGQAARSPAEAGRIAEVWHSLQGVAHVDCEGVQHVLGPGDVLIVAPYNNQVGEIRSLLPAARVGTVDKFQGQEAPVVLYSMTSSSAEDAPRGVGFLYDLHRLNVAVSRAQALAVVVGSPRLLDAAVHSPEQLRRVNALCRLAEVAPRLPAVSSPST